MTVGNQRGARGFSVLELLVVVAVISVLGAILVPALGKARRQVRSLIGAVNQKQVVGGVTLFSMDNNDNYPESVATVGFGPGWNWSDPMKMTGNHTRSPGMHRSMSAYLRGYIDDAAVMFCPNAPRQYEYLQESWEAGDDWDNPDTSFPADPVTGTYCFYWNYTGYLTDKPYPFRGPSGSADGRGRSTLLVSDYFGYGHWRSPGCYGSCDRINGASIVQETWLLSAYWSTDGTKNRSELGAKPRAGYTDGHVSTYTADETITMRVSMLADGSVPFASGASAGDIYLPADCLR
ncbi:MAG: prepilin-type N-terminal cleavage/methylation domain-containing protein [Phycisphaerae bacterium]|nr:prepilin-type N-terminal cleavage/methylation domain-containing protein [Phycisphaerae bacterium]